MRYDITSIIMTMIFKSNICNKCYGARGEIGRHYAKSSKPMIGQTLHYSIELGI